MKTDWIFKKCDVLNDSLKTILGAALIQHKVATNLQSKSIQFKGKAQISPLVTRSAFLVCVQALVSAESRQDLLVEQGGMRERRTQDLTEGFRKGQHEHQSQNNGERVRHL